MWSTSSGNQLEDKRAQNSATEVSVVLSGGVLSALSSCWSPLLVHHCDITYVAMCTLATTTMRPNTIVCVNEHVAKLLSVWKLQDTPGIACDWSLQESCKILIGFCSSQESCELLKPLLWKKKCVYPILGVSWELLYINWNKPLYWQTLNKAWVQAGRCKRSLPRYPQGH